MPSPTFDDATTLPPGVLDAVRRHWGYSSLRPLQAEAIAAELAQRDSVVVMPTGGGKSLCYQVPPLISGRLTVVVSPLIALMNDQVAGLTLVGYPAAALHSHVEPEEAAEIRRRAASGELRLLFVAPERLLTEPFLAFLRSLKAPALGGIAIDEAHCISQWGHDFRPEYRRLAELRQRFPGVALHAYTATATPRVRDDIAAQLALRDPSVLVGRFDRPNLTYRVIPRVRLAEQIEGALRRHEGSAAIVYCISRKDTESVAESLRNLPGTRSIEARAYHAGMTPDQRARVQTRFKTERLNVVVATVAFGMGIDRGDVRCVIHAAMPKSIEHYQQETGRAGRDGLAAECVLFTSAADGARWRRLMERSAEESGAAPESLAAQAELLAHMQRFASAARCRHAALSEYFGQAYAPPSDAPSTSGCGACDVCLGELAPVEDATVLAQKILSCIARVRGAFGAAHIADVLRGRATQRITQRGHHELSTFGLLRGARREAVIAYIEQLIDLGALDRDEGEHGRYPTLRLNAASLAVLRGQRGVSLVEAKPAAGVRAERVASPGARREDALAGLSDDERALFESLRVLRREIADERGVPPFMIFADTTLIELARARPASEAAFVQIRGVGQAKLGAFGRRFIDHIRAGGVAAAPPRAQEKAPRTAGL